MPHQCLKCGNLFPDGSTDILRGCPDCKGTRFFYTEHALGEPERVQLLDQGTQDVQAILEDLAAEPQKPEPSQGDWLVAKAPVRQASVRPAAPVHLPKRALAGLRKRRLIRRVQQRTEIRWDYDAPDPSPPEPATTPPRAPAEPPTPDLAPWPPDPVAEAAVRAPVAPLRAVEDVTAGPPPVEFVTPAPRDHKPPPVQDLATRASLNESEDPYEDQPETVSIRAPGEYNIDVKRLMDEAPIVIQRDGSYMIHLPSLFESREGRGSRRNQ